MSCHPGSDCYSCGWVDKEHHFPVSLILRGNWETGELNQTELHCSTLCHAREIGRYFYIYQHLTILQWGALSLQAISQQCHITFLGSLQKTFIKTFLTVP